MDKEQLLVAFVLALLERAAAANRTLLLARQEGRDVTDAEIDAVMAKDEATRAELELEIEGRRG